MIIIQHHHHASHYRLLYAPKVVTDGHQSKSLMFFDGCQSRLGCTLLLRGATCAELRKVKRVARFMIFACYNARMERSFLADEFAVPKIPGGIGDIFDDSSPGHCSNSSSGSSDNNSSSSKNRKDVPALTSSPLPGSASGSHHTFESGSLVMADGESSLLSGGVGAGGGDDNDNDDDDERGDASGSDSGDCGASCDLLLQPPRATKDSPSDSAANWQHLKSVSELDDPLHEYLRSRQGGDQSMDSTPVDHQAASNKMGLHQMHSMANNNSSTVMHTSPFSSNTMLFRKAMVYGLIILYFILFHSFHTFNQ